MNQCGNVCSTCKKPKKPQNGGTGRKQLKITYIENDKNDF